MWSWWTSSAVEIGPGWIVGALIVIGSPAIAQRPGQIERDTIPGTDVELILAFVPGGSFRLGSPPEQPGRDADEGPQRRIEVEAFWMGIHEVTHEQFAIFRFPNLDSPATADPDIMVDVDAITRPSPPYEDPAHGMGQGKHPATGMTQWGALQYAKWLSEKTGRLFRLPTEAEWEYACRAGGPASIPRDLDRVAWYLDNSGERFHPVAGKTANPWGLYDMLGNVAEWTMDQYRESWYERLVEGARNPWAQPERTHPRSVRGGAYDDAPAQLRCQDRVRSTLRWKRRDPQLPQSRWWNTDSPHVGFRLVSPARPMTRDAIQRYWLDLLGN